MYPVTFSTSCFLLLFCHFGSTEPPPARGYGPPSPVEFGSNEIGSHEQLNAAPFDFSNYNFNSGPSSSYSVPSGSYTKSGPSFSPHYSHGGPSYKSGPGGKGGTSSSYISIIHGGNPSGGPGGPSKIRNVPYAISKKGPAPIVSSYNGGPNYNGPVQFSSGTDSKEYGGSSNAYGSSEVGSGGFNFKGFGGAPASYQSAGAGSYEGYTGDYNKAGAGYESGGASDEVASYSSGGPSYATFSGAKAPFGSNFGHGTRSSSGNAYSTSNVNIGSGGVSGKVSGHGNFNAPSYSSNFKPGGGAKVYSRYSSGPNSGAFPSFSNSDNGYNSRALKSAYNVDDEFSGEETNVFGDGAGFKVQSSYSTG